MRRAITPVLLAVALLSASATNASAAGLFGHHLGGCCDTAPVCEPVCGAEMAPAYGCDTVDPCGAPKRPVRDFLHGLFHKHDSCCDVAPACEPACGLEAAPICEPACGLEVAPACGCQAVDSCCAPKRGGLLKKLFSKNRCGCDNGCDVAPVCEPACGCEVAAPSCGCGF
jgi:hypothetical protein